MKRIIVIGMLFGIVLSNYPLYGQRSLKEPSAFDLWEYWSVNFTLGRTSFYGDVSLKDDDFMEKLSTESGLGFGLKIQKNINPVLLVGLQMVRGNLNGENSKSYFESDLYEFSLFTHIDVVNLFTQRTYSKLGMHAMAGLGRFYFTSYLDYKDQPGTLTINTGVPEFVYMAGGNIKYSITEWVDLTAELILRQAKNDMIDSEKRGGNLDYYTYINAGVTVYITRELNKFEILKSKRGGTRYPLRRRW